MALPRKSMIIIFQKRHYLMRVKTICDFHILVGSQEKIME